MTAIVQSGKYINSHQESVRKVSLAFPDIVIHSVAKLRVFYVRLVLELFWIGDLNEVFLNIFPWLQTWRILQNFE